jgi:hypothetical protein
MTERSSKKACEYSEDGSLIKVECGKGKDSEKFVCGIVSEGKNGSGQLMGTGLGGGYIKSNVRCFSIKDLGNEIAEKLGIKPEKLELIKKEMR